MRRIAGLALVLLLLFLMTSCLSYLQVRQFRSPSDEVVRIRVFVERSGDEIYLVENWRGKRRIIYRLSGNLPILLKSYVNRQIYVDVVILSTDGMFTRKVRLVRIYGY